MGWLLASPGPRTAVGWLQGCRAAWPSCKAASAGKQEQSRPSGPLQMSRVREGVREGVPLRAQLGLPCPPPEACFRRCYLVRACSGWACESWEESQSETLHFGNLCQGLTSRGLPLHVQLRLCLSIPASPDPLT